jgi:uncharacterized protein YegJ (DUF2314 family)
VRWHPFLFAALVFVSTAATWARAEGIADKARRDEVARVARGDPDMEAAFRAARASLQDFLKLARAPRTGMSQFALKVKIDEGDTTEFFWVAPFREVDNGFSGIVNNTPATVHSVSFGQRITFAADDVFDWMYVDRGVMKGNFTACALLKHEAPSEAEAMRKDYGLTCEPPPGQ